MNPERWEEIDRLFQTALDMEPSRRQQYLNEVCRGDESLRKQVESLLANQMIPEGFLSRPAMDLVAQSVAREQKEIATNLIGGSLSHYRIIDRIGVGGMGEVYRAEDSILGRQVAIKVLPEIFGNDPERLARFEREAKLLASLSHANIATLHGLEESEGQRFIVMELVEGETLAQRLLKGPLPVNDALEVCRQIAEGLEAAHEKGVIHRDLKPANVMITADEKVKILDFGLAKALVAQSSAAAATQSPTITEAMTRAGTILGTAAYMAPEQAKGKPVDKRADIWAFGCILFECLTGKRAFPGEMVTETIAAILKGEPDWKSLPADAPNHVGLVLRRCLQKDLKLRYHDIADAWIEIEEQESSPAIGRTRFGRLAAGLTFRSSLALWLIGIVGFIVGSLATGLLYQRIRAPAAQPPPQVLRAVTGIAPADRLQSIPRDVIGEQRPSLTAIALSPDGRIMVFSAVRGDRQHLYIRATDQLEATPIPDSEGGASPFFSPDGKWIGFWAKGELRKVAVAGGPATTICRTESICGASWGENDTIVFAKLLSCLFQVPAAGGTPRPVTTLDQRRGEVSHRLPQMLPGARAVLYTVITHFLPDWDGAEIVVQPLTGDDRRVLTHGADARYAPSGHLVFVRYGTVVAVPFDLKRLDITGGEMTVISDVMQAANTPGDDLETGAAQLAVSSSGLLAYATGGILRDRENSLVWVDRSGKTQPLPLPPPPRAYLAPHLSADGQRVVLWSQGRERVVWVYDLLRGTLTRLTAEGRNSRAIWAPDDRHVTFASATAGYEYVATKLADGSGEVERLAVRGLPSSWSPDGKVLAFVTSLAAGSAQRAIGLLPIGEKEPRLFANSRFNELYPEFSPDGHWIAYSSNETGQYEVYVRAYSGPGERRQLSNHGGTQPAWARNGRELYYTEIDSVTQRMRMMSVSLTAGTSLVPGVPRLLWEGSFMRQAVTRGYDVTPDGQRFLMFQRKERPPSPVTQLVVVQNWFEELKRLVPTGGK